MATYYSEQDTLQSFDEYYYHGCCTRQGVYSQTRIGSLQESSGPKLHPSDEDESKFFGEFLCKSQPERGAQVQKKGRNFRTLQSSTQIVGETTQEIVHDSRTRRQQIEEKDAILFFALSFQDSMSYRRPVFVLFFRWPFFSYIYNYRTRRYTNSVNSN